jgi:hypothetical protein
MIQATSLLSREKRCPVVHLDPRPAHANSSGSRIGRRAHILSISLTTSSSGADSLPARASGSAAVFCSRLDESMPIATEGSEYESPCSSGTGSVLEAV